MQKLKVVRLGFITLLIALTGMLYFFQERLLFRSVRLPQDYAYQFTTSYEELFLTATDGAVLNGLHFKQPKPKGVILYCHGNAGALDVWGKWAQELSNRYNYDVVVWDYRGYGKSIGKRRQALMLADGVLFYDYCKGHFKEKNIIVFGRSLGGFFATHLAVARQPHKLILESTPTSVLDVAHEQYPLLPTKLLLKFPFQNHRNIELIKNSSTYIIHGKEDDLVPYEHQNTLYRLSAAKFKKAFSIEQANHNNLAEFESYFQALDEIFEK
ncbi:alpha/beta hydrolase [uncultured Kriegella sp.]|uniref:alpha/beta hydrolase n=1 Tax=uncultured Kriegella sp. TaxID=1798910 RepID=UPI0030DA6BF6|tara:strand:+ start:96795 stop:97601 length:807 start_codon:yes stop_codon:yes gene_type:complete